MTTIREPFIYKYTGSDDDIKSLNEAIKFRERGVEPYRLTIIGVNSSASAVQISVIANNLSRYALRGTPVRVCFEEFPDVSFCDSFIKHTDNFVIPEFSTTLTGPSFFKDQSVHEKISSVRQTGIKTAISFEITPSIIQEPYTLAAFVRTQIANCTSVNISLPKLLYTSNERKTLTEFIRSNGFSFLVDDFSKRHEESFDEFYKRFEFKDASCASECTEIIQNIFEYELRDLSMNQHQMLNHALNYRRSIDSSGRRSINEIMLSRVSI